MRRIYLFDLGLLVAAGTIAAVLTARPASSDADDAQEHTAPSAAPEASVASPAPHAISDQWHRYEEDDPGSR